jgi:hypothetical protein
LSPPGELEIDVSMDLQLHPLRDSKWSEIFPILNIFNNPKSEDFGVGKRQMSKAYEFMKNEAIFAESHRGSGLEDFKTKSNIQRLR